MSLRHHVGGGALALAVLTALSLPAAASTGIGMAGQAQLVCGAGVSGPTGAATGSSQVDLGSLNDFCNDPEGYQVFIDYPPSLDSATLIVNGTPVPLTSAGTVRVDSASQANQTSLSLALAGSTVTGPVPLTVRMVPTNASTYTLVASNGP
jgi:hypothetical protein